jgi:uncharacterized membrane protein (DUF2068 family)
MKDVLKPGYLGFEVIGIYKLISGAMALAVGIGAVRFFDHDPGPRAERIITHLGLDTQNQVVHAVLSRVTGIDHKHLALIEAGTFCYALLHLIEGVGLILRRDWAGYLVIGATSSLIPIEIYEIARKHSALRIGLLIANAAIVLYLIATLRRRHQIRAAQQKT